MINVKELSSASRSVLRSVALSILLCLISITSVYADDVHVVRDTIFSYRNYSDPEAFSWYPSASVNGGTVYSCRLESGYLNEPRNLTPPIKELTFTFETESKKTGGCPTFYASLAAVSPSGKRVIPDSLTSKDYEGLCEENCSISSTRKQYSYLGCSAGWCYESAFFYYLKFPVGSEAGEWRLELTIYYSQNVTVGSLTTREKRKKVILLPEPLVIAPTSAPTTSTSTPPTTTSALPPTTTIQITVPVEQTPASSSLSGKSCKVGGKTLKKDGIQFVCTKVGKVLRWKPLK